MQFLIIFGTAVFFVLICIACHFNGKWTREREIVSHRVDDLIGFEAWITKEAHREAMARWKLAKVRDKQPHFFRVISGGCQTAKTAAPSPATKAKIF